MVQLWQARENQGQGRQTKERNRPFPDSGHDEEGKADQEEAVTGGEPADAGWWKGRLPRKGGIIRHVCASDSGTSRYLRAVFTEGESEQTHSCHWSPNTLPQAVGCRN